jgi:hypothetical protein
VNCHLEAIAPRVAKVEERPRQDFHACFGQRLADGVLVVNHESEMATLIRGLLAAFLARQCSACLLVCCSAAVRTQSDEPSEAGVLDGICGRCASFKVRT